MNNCSWIQKIFANVKDCQKMFQGPFTNIILEFYLVDMWMYQNQIFSDNERFFLDSHFQSTLILRFWDYSEATLKPTKLNWNQTEFWNQFKTTLKVFCDYSETILQLLYSLTTLTLWLWNNSETILRQLWDNSESETTLRLLSGYSQATLRLLSGYPETPLRNILGLR